MMEVQKTIATVALGSMSTNEKPMVLKAAGMEMQLKLESVDKLANASLTLDTGLSVEVPSVFGGEDIGGGDEPPAIGSTVSVITRIMHKCYSLSCKLEPVLFVPAVID